MVARYSLLDVVVASVSILFFACLLGASLELIQRRCQTGPPLVILSEPDHASLELCAAFKSFKAYLAGFSPLLWFFGGLALSQYLAQSVRVALLSASLASVLSLSS